MIDIIQIVGNVILCFIMLGYVPKERHVSFTFILVTYALFNLLCF